MVLRCAAVILLLSSSCYYGAMHGAHTLGDDHITLTAGATLPAYFSADDREEAESTREDYLTTYPSIDFTVGATDQIDLGGSIFAYGVGPFVRYGLLPSTDRDALSATLTMNYVAPMQVIMPRLSLCAGRIFGDDLEVFAGSDMGYGPDLANIPDTETGSHDWDSVENTFFAALRAGCHFTIRSPGGPNEEKTYLPESVIFQFSVPLGLDRSMILAGFGVSY